MIDLEQFKRNYLVSGLTAEQSQKIAALATVRTLTANEVLIRGGEHLESLFIVIEGRVDVLTHDGDKLAEVGPGSVLGEVHLIDARPSSAAAVAASSVKVAAIPARELRALMASDSQMGFLMLCNLSRVLCGRLRMADERIDALLDQVDHTQWAHAQ